MESLQPRIYRPKAPYNDRIEWADNRLPSTGALDGREVALERDDGRAVSYSFAAKTVSWYELDGTSALEAPYDAVELREGVFSVDILHPASSAGSSTRVATSLALHMQTGGALIVRNTVRLGAHTDFRQLIHSCAVAGSGGSRPEMSAELVGRRAYAEYTKGGAAEHLYLNPRRLGTQALGDSDYASAKMDDSTTWKLDEDLFVLTWVQEWNPVGAVLLMDFSGLRNAGVFMGGDDEGFFHFVVGAHLAVLGQTSYPPGREPAGLDTHPTSISLQPRFNRPRAPYGQRFEWTDNRLPRTDALAGREISLVRDDGLTVTFVFGVTTVRWQEPGEGSTVEAPYDAVELRDHVLSVDFQHPELAGGWSTRVATSLALNTQTGAALLVRNTVTLAGEGDLRQDVYPCTIAGSGASPPTLTGELVGRRAYAEYSDATAMEHVYINSRRFGAQPLGKVDAAVSDICDSTTWKLGEELYVLTWVEEWDPTGAVLLMDFAGLRNAGVFMGRDDGGFFRFVCGARLVLLGETDYPPGYEPEGFRSVSAG
ncbi:MAG TPA: MoaF C-terminal domain-containing protein [Acidimicrobiales bacterium]|nr:MoaF C-terminal domain-containing protein [Acidimicrobiales bacterium]